MTSKNKLILFIPILAVAGISFFLLSKKEKDDKLFHESNENSFFFAQNQEKDLANNEISSARKNIITETVRKISPAIVGINVTEIRQYKRSFQQLF